MAASEDAAQTRNGPLQVSIERPAKGVVADDCLDDLVLEPMAEAGAVAGHCHSFTHSVPA